MKKLFILCSIMVLSTFQYAFSQGCTADAGSDISICDGDGSSSNYTYLDGGNSIVPDGEVNFEWTVLTIVVNGEDEETLVITNSE